jgi:hypothetical protein
MHNGVALRRRSRRRSTKMRCSGSNNVAFATAASAGVNAVYVAIAMFVAIGR